MKTILFLGARGKTCQVSRIESSFRRYLDFTVLNHETLSSSPDYIFCNDAGYFDQAISIKAQSSGKTKIILNVLDLFAHIQTAQADEQRKKIGQQIKQADVVTTIASYCVKEISDLFNIKSELIYNPMIPIRREDTKNRFSEDPNNWKFLFVGRNCDPNRRVVEGIRGLLRFGFGPSNFVSFGSENIGYGNYLGVISEEEMNDQYNRCHFLLFPSLYSGLGLPVVESIAGGMIPLCCSDMTTLPDILPENDFPEYYSFRDSRSAEENINKLFNYLVSKHNNDSFSSFSIRLSNHYNRNLENLYSPESVAKRIFDICNGL